MTYQFITLSEAHNAELLHLFEATETGSNTFRVSRGTNFFALTKEAGQTTYYGITKNQLLVACIGVTMLKRYVSGIPEEVYYIRDLRMDAKEGNAIVFGKLIKGLNSVYRGVSGNSFSVILGENPNRHSITAGKSLFQTCRQMGEIIHAGFPLFYGSTQYDHVVQINAGEAWGFYYTHTRTTDFALADEEYFKSANGVFLGVRQNGRLRAICKIVDQEQCRQIIALRKPTLAEQLLNMYCRLKKVKGLPGKDEVFAHCYLSFYTAAPSTDYRQVFIAYLRKHYASRYCYVFTGLLPEDQHNYNEPFMIRFNSIVYGYRDTPDIRFRFPELTLI